MHWSCGSCADGKVLGPLSVCRRSTAQEQQRRLTLGHTNRARSRKRCVVAGAASARSSDFNSVLRWKTSFARVLGRTHDPKPRSPTRKAQSNAKPKCLKALHASRLEHAVANSRPRVAPSSLFPPPPLPRAPNLRAARSSSASFPSASAVDTLTEMHQAGPSHLGSLP